MQPLKLARRKRSLHAILLAACLSNTFPGAGQELKTIPTASSTPTPVLELIHRGDVLDVDFVGSLEFDWRGTLTNEGFLDGLERAEKPVFALCRTEAEVAAAVANAFAHFLRDPKVNVKIVDRSNRPPAYVTGAVRSSHRFQLRRNATLMELIVLSGGITDSSNGEVVIFRPPDASCGQAQTSPTADPHPSRTVIQIADLIAGRPEANPSIFSGDIVSLVEAPPVYVIGEVAAARRMNLTPELTLTRAIASAGGLLRSYSGQKARIHRRGEEGRVLEFDLRQIREKKVEDPRLKPFDVIEVEQKGSTAPKIIPIEDQPEASQASMAKLPLRIVD